jgi:putative aldouronate transport system permease protein
MFGYMNTVIVVAGGLAVNIFLSSLGAYCLSRKNVFWNSLFSKLIVITMVFSGGIIPLFLTVKELGLYNTRLSLILPVAINTYNLIIMRTTFAEIPDNVIESAQIDGAGHFTVLLRLVMPLSKAVLAVMVLYYGVYHWNSWANAVMFIRDPDKFPLQVILWEILLQNQTTDMVSGTGEMDRFSVSETIKYATVIIATVPILAIYPFLQKYFQKGIMIGSVKG